MGAKKLLGLFMLSLVFALSCAQPAMADSSLQPENPKYPYIVWDIGHQRSLVVHLLNATPYDLKLSDSTFKDVVLTSSPVLYPAQGDNNTPPYAFLPGGLPTGVKANTGASFVVVWMDTGGKADKALPNAYIHYTMDNVDSSAMYTADGCTTNSQKGSVKLLLNFDRESNNSKGEKSDVMKLILHATSALVDGAELLVEPANPLAWAGFVTASTEASEDIKDINEISKSDYQVFTSAFIMSYDGNTAKTPGIISAHSLDDGADEYDGIVTQQASGNGCPQSSLAVAVAVLREQAPSSKSLAGSLPTLVVLVATMDEWNAAVAAKTDVSLQASKAGHQISQQMKREDKNGKKAWFKLVRTLKSADMSMMTEAYRSIHAGKALTHEQEALLARVAAAFEKHAATVEPATKTIQTTPGKSKPEGGMKK